MKRLLWFSIWWVIALLIFICWEAVILGLVYSGSQWKLLPIYLFPRLLAATMLITTPILFVLFFLAAIMFTILNISEEQLSAFNKMLFITACAGAGFIIDMVLIAAVDWYAFGFDVPPSYEGFWRGTEWFDISTVSIGAAFAGAIIGYGYLHLYKRSNKNAPDSELVSTF